MEFIKTNHQQVDAARIHERLNTGQEVSHASRVQRLWLLAPPTLCDILFVESASFEKLIIKLNDVPSPFNDTPHEKIL